jgi:hypothetical protein
MRDNLFIATNIDSFPRFNPIILLAEHLAVFGVGAAAKVPGGYVVGFHFVEFVMFVAFYTDALLAFVRFALLLVGKRAEAEVLFVAG